MVSESSRFTRVLPACSAVDVADPSGERRRPGSVDRRLLIEVPLRPIVLTSPRKVWKALTSDPSIISWLDSFSAQYSPPKVAVNLIYPCAATKPFNNAPSYRQLAKTLGRLNGDRESVHVYTISEPFGLVPEEFAEYLPKYDCPGLFRWWCLRNSEDYEIDYLERSILRLAESIAPVIQRMQGQILAAVRTYTSQSERRIDHTHFRILYTASRLAERKIEFIPSRSLVEKIVDESGGFAWDRYGPAHPMVHSYLERRIREVISSD